MRKNATFKAPTNWLIPVRTYFLGFLNSFPFFRHIKSPNTPSDLYTRLRNRYTHKNVLFSSSDGVPKGIQDTLFVEEGSFWLIPPGRNGYASTVRFPNQ